MKNIILELFIKKLPAWGIELLFEVPKENCMVPSGPSSSTGYITREEFWLQ